MPTIKIFPLIAALLLSIAVYGKGHGGHGGHHGGHHSSHHSSHPSSHHSSHNFSHHTSHPASHHSSHNFGHHTSHHSTHHSNHHATRSHSSRSGSASRTIKSPNLFPVRIGARPIRNTSRNQRPHYLHSGNVGNKVYEPSHTGSPYYYDGYYGYPYFDYTYHNLFWLMMRIGFTPNYGYGPTAGYHYNRTNPHNNTGGTVEDNLEGYVVYAQDTLRGHITFNKKAIYLQKTDSGTNYDYKFKPGQSMLTAVWVVNEDNKQLDLVRLKEKPKKLWRLIHEGKLNLYDRRRDFIYQTEDIDINNLLAVSNGNEIDLSSTTDEAKESLTALINTTYGTNLDATRITWKELLIYIDKLD